MSWPCRIYSTVTTLVAVWEDGLCWLVFLQMSSVQHGDAGTQLPSTPGWVGGQPLRLGLHRDLPWKPLCCAGEMSPSEPVAASRAPGMLLGGWQRTAQLCVAHS